MLSRALILAAVAFALGCFGTIPARAQNLEAGKSPSQIFSNTCSLCHKSSRGLLKGVSPGSLPGFLRQHYTTSSDMAAAMSAYVLSNGAANAPVAGGNLTRQGQEAKGGRPPEASEPGAEHAGRGRKPPTREASRPDADGLQRPSEPGAATQEPALTARQKAAAERRAARQAARSKADTPPKIEDRHEPQKDEPGKDEAAKLDPSKSDPSKSDSAKPDSGSSDQAKSESKPDQAKPDPNSETAKVEGTRPDPVPAVTPAPKETDKPAEVVATAPPKIEIPSGPLTIDMGPAPAPRAAAPSASVVSAAGKPQPPISR